MSAVPAPGRPVPDWVGRLRVTQWRVVVSEWTKLRSLRSTLWSLFVAVVFTIGLPCLFATVTAVRWSHMSLHERLDRHPLEIATAGVNLSQLAIGVLGVLIVTGEYSTGMIRASFGAVPKRLPVLWAKIAVFAAATFALMVPSVILGFVGSQAILRNHHILEISFSHAGVARTVIGGAIFLTVVGIFTMGLGAITRNTAGGISFYVGVIFVIPPLMFVLPLSWNEAISKYLPSNAGADIFTLNHGPHDLAPWTGFGLLCVYAAVSVGVAAVLLARRDT
jgi:ABC-type transport system involved in multi-copper enzyme maturation permease subunit